MERGLQRLTPWVIRRRAIIVPIAVALTVAGLVSAPHVKTETDWSNLFSENVQVVTDYKTLQEVAPGTTSTNVLVEAGDVANPETLAWMLEVESYIAAELEGTVARTESVADLVVRANGGAMPQSEEEVKRVLEGVPAPLRRNLITDDYTAANIVVTLRGEEEGQIEKVSAALARCPVDPPSGVKTALTGAHTINMKLFDALSSGRTKMTLIGVGFVFLGLLVLFRFSVLRALLATLPIGLIIGWSSGLMFLSGTDYNPLTATMGALILAIGVEYTVLLMMRYYEERDEGREPREAMTTATSRIGRAIVASGLTDIGGFAALLAATDFLMLQAFGIMTVINVSLALVSTLVVLPGLIVWVDSWQGKRQLAREEIESVKADIVESIEQELKEKVRSA